MLSMAANTIFDLIKNYKPDLLPHNGEMAAAIAIVIREHNNQYEMMLIERSQLESDPWSGQMAFPGGKIDAVDSDARAAAERETHEEVAVKLQPTEYLGQLDDMYGIKVRQTHKVLLSSFVYFIERDVQPAANYEVADIVWVPINYFTDEKRISMVIHPRDKSMKLPGIRIDGSNTNPPRIVWGLTFRVIMSMLRAANLKILIPE